MIDVTVGGSTANSYCTLAEADAFAAIDLGPDVDEWLAAADSRREAALIQATLDIDAYEPVSLPSPYSATQALRYPRSTDVAASIPFLPPNLKLATYRQAKYRLANAAAMAEARSRQARELSSFSDDDGSGTRTLRAERWPTEVLVLLRPIVATTRRGGRFFSVPLVSSGGWLE